jgi:hypothetical protein
MEFQPAWDAGYRHWLKLTPWAPDRPLPLSPPTLVWQDVIPLAGLIALGTFRGHPHPAALLTAFGFTYLLVTSIALFTGGARWAALALLAGLPVVLLPEVSGWHATGVVAALYAVVAFAGIRQMLRGFPWEDVDGGAKPVGRKVNLNQNATPEPLVGWPLKQLAPEPPPAKPVAWHHAAVGCALLGWWMYAVMRALFPHETADPDGRIVRGVLLMAGAAFAGLRLVLYMNQYAPPISLFGRIATGWFVIPGYDVVFVAPLCVLLAAAQLPALLRAEGVGVIPSIASGIATLLLLAIVIGPGLREWRLTGRHRIGKSARENRKSPQPGAAAGAGQFEPARADRT